MTGMSASAASWSTCDSVVPSIEAMMSASAPLVIMFSICETWVGMSSSAYWRSTVKPCSSSCSLTESPSWIQRSELLVGIATPMRPPSPPPSPPPPPLPPEHAASASMEPAASVARSTFFVFFTVCPFTVCPSWTSLSW